jgi:hypothetical protein
MVWERCTFYFYVVCVYEYNCAENICRGERRMDGGVERCMCVVSTSIVVLHFCLKESTAIGRMILRTRKHIYIQ